MAARTAAVIEKWSTGLVEPERRLDYWIGAVCECFLEMDITTPVRSGFDCSVQRGQLDTIGINRVEGSAQHVYRRKASLGRSASNYYYLLCKTDNDWTVMQNGHRSVLQPHDLVLLDSRRCYEFNFPVTANTLSLELPIAWVEFVGHRSRTAGRAANRRAHRLGRRAQCICVPVITPSGGRPAAARAGSHRPARRPAGAGGGQRDSGHAVGAARGGQPAGSDRPRHPVALRRTGPDGRFRRGASAGFGADGASLPQQVRPDV